MANWPLIGTVRKKMNAFRGFLKKPAESGLNYALGYKQRKTRPKDHYLIACMPKSGSTFLANALSELTGYPYVYLAYAYERSEQNLYLPKLIDHYDVGTVTHLHLRATDSAIDLMRMFSIRPVILVRDIFDVVVSIRDHLFNEGYEFPTFFCDESIKRLDEQTQFDFIIEHGIPWYFNFFVSWHQALAGNRADGLWLKYEEVINDWFGALRMIADFYQIDKTDAQIELALKQTSAKSRKKTRLNKGVAGRSLTLLTDQQRDRIIRMARFYPDVDFSRMGIENR